MSTETPGRAASQTRADDLQLSAYNGAFWDLGFKWQWDAATYRELCGVPGEKERIRAYVERHQPHLAAAYDLDFLAGLIHDHKTKRHAAIVAAHEAGRMPDLSCNGVRGG
ncbi:MAG: LysR family transcriptional regulator [Burkholderiales bacterium]|nr:LysR family transcriptional regulator [Burkholderiales bacterium]